MFIEALLWKPFTMSQWSDNEAEHYQFKDKWIGDRFRQILDAVSSLPGESIPQICQNWAEKKAGGGLIIFRKPMRKWLALHKS